MRTHKLDEEGTGIFRMYQLLVKSRVLPAIWPLLAGLVIVPGNASPNAESTRPGIIDTQTFLETVEELSHINDLRDSDKVAAILGVQFIKYREGRRVDFRPIALPIWLGSMDYALIGSPPGSELQYITLSIAPPPCVTPQDVRGKFGSPNVRAVDQTTIPTFLDDKSARAYLYELEHGPGVDSMNYRQQDRDATVEFYFGFRICVQSTGISIKY